jgi:magnesium chelatase accessory protein
MVDTLQWDRDGRDWPHRAHSRFVDAAGLMWHVQRMGEGPSALLLHGTGASTHSWRAMMPRLAQHFDVVAMDLPGHAFTGTPPDEGMTLNGMARAVGGLVESLRLDVRLVVAHSAGAAIAMRMVLDGRIAPDLVVAVNGAFFPLGGFSGLVFPTMARLMAATPIASHFFARRHWDRRAVERLLAGTGSTLDDEGLDLYGRLVRDPTHAAGALAMMAYWDLSPLERDMVGWRTPLVLVVGAKDRAVAPADARRLQARAQVSAPCSVEELPGVGHLAHEEDPDAVFEVIEHAWRRVVDPDRPT